MSEERARNKQALYSMAMIEALRRAIYLRPYEGPYQVVLLLEADALRQEAANALLKTLEEPPERAVFVLSTSRPERLLPTLLSRTQKVRFEPLTEALIEEALRARGLGQQEASLLARMAAGNLSRALSLLRVSWSAEREAALRWLRALATGRRLEMLRYVEEAQRISREQLKDRLQTLLFWLHDLWRYRIWPEPKGLYYPDQIEVLARFHRNLPGVDLEAMIAALEEALEAIERNGNALLVCMALSLRLERALRREAVSSWR